MSACGGVGSALPFLTGTMASKLGMESFTTFVRIPARMSPKFSFKLNFYFLGSLLPMMIILGTVWGFVPKKRKITC